MMWDELFERYDKNTQAQMQAVFTSLFVLQNRMQTAGDKLQRKISMKQWLLLAMVEACPEPKTLTRVATLMGCSRQNVKKLALALEAKGFVKLEQGSRHSLQVVLTDKAAAYNEQISPRHAQALRLIFADFSSEEVDQLFGLYRKLYAGIERVENYAREIQHDEI